MSNPKELLHGALLGGVLGGAAALLLAPKSGKELREDLCELGECGAGFKDDLIEKGQHLFNCEEEEECHNPSNFLVGAALGTVIGSVAALLLAPSSGKKLRDALGDQYDNIHDKAEDFVQGVNEKKNSVINQAEEWKDTLGTIINKLSVHSKGKNHSKIDQILDWADVGMKVMQQIQKRR